MKPINCGTPCRLNHPFNKDRRAECERKKSCACNMSELEVLNPILYDAALKECNSESPPKDADDYLCNRIGGDVLFDLYGIVQCGFDPSESILFGLEEDRAQKVQAAQTSQMNLVYLAGGLLVLVLLILRISKSRK